MPQGKRIEFPGAVSNFDKSEYLLYQEARAACRRAAAHPPQSQHRIRYVLKLKWPTGTFW